MNNLEGSFDAFSINNCTIDLDIFNGILLPLIESPDVDSNTN